MLFKFVDVFACVCVHVFHIIITCSNFHMKFTNTMIMCHIIEFNFYQGKLLCLNCDSIDIVFFTRLLHHISILITDHIRFDFFDLADMISGLFFDRQRVEGRFGGSVRGVGLP